jgi:hypothetical protein
MNSIRFTVAAVLAAAAALAVALGRPAHAGTTIPVEGGGATGITLVDMSVNGSGAPRSRADVAAEARATWRQMNSRSGEQTDAEEHLHVRATSTRSRDEVRREAIAFSRQAHPDVFEGGQSGMMTTMHARLPARSAPAQMAASTSD